MEESFVCESCEHPKSSQKESNDNNFNFEDFMDKIKSSKKLIVMEIGASWCPRCKQMKSIFDSLNDNFKESVEFVYLDYDRNQKGVEEKFDVMSLPTVVFIKQGKEVYRFNELQSKIKIVNNIKSYL